MSDLLNVKLTNPKCLRRQDESISSKERRAELLKQHTTAGIARLVADDRFDAEKDVEVWSYESKDDGETKVGWFLRWCQTKKAVKEKSMEQMSANQVCSINYWDKIKPVELNNNSKRKAAQKVPANVEWPSEDGSGSLVEVPVATSAQGKAVVHPNEPKPRAQASPAIKVSASSSNSSSSSLSLITDAASAEVEKSNAVLNGMTNRAVSKKPVDLYTPARAHLKVAAGETVTLAHMAAQISIDKASDTDNEALTILKKPAPREETWQQWVSEITEQNTTEEPKKVVWRAIVPIAVEAGNLVAKQMSKAATEQIQSAQKSAMRLEKSLAQSEDMAGIVAGENSSLKERNAALEAKIATLEEEMVKLRAELAEAKAAAAPANGHEKSKAEKKEQKKQRKEEKKEKKRLASEDDAPALPAHKKVASPKKQPQSHASAAISDDADEV